MNSFYYVYKSGSEMPKVRHDDGVVALNEAKRLAALHPGARFEILRCVGIASMEPLVEWLGKDPEAKANAEECVKEDLEGL